MTTTCDLPEEELWSGLDRREPHLEAHLSTCMTCRERAVQFRAGVAALQEIATPKPLPLPERIGSYVVHRRLGEGGMGIVYEAEQESPKRLVAIKVVRGGRNVDEYHLRLFEREAQTLARLKHPSIAAIYHGGRTEDGAHYFAMELVHGVPLVEYVRQQQVSRHGRLQIFREIGHAINYAHQRGVIHRDLKPSNILVDADGHPKILDFGLARITEPDGSLATATHDVGRIMGTLPYMSPEEARGNPDEIDVRSDVYSLGVIFYELMTEHLPYTVKRTALPEAVRIICEAPPQRPSVYDRSLRGDLETIALKALEKESSRRYQSAAAMTEDVERYLSDQPILARRASPLYELRKLIARHRLFFFSMAAMVAAILAIAYVNEQSERERRASTQSLIDLNSLAVAKIENNLAEELHRQERWTEAEPRYKNALSTFRRLNRDKEAVPGLMRLADLLIMRTPQEGRNKESDYEEAETLLFEALEWIRQRAAEELDTQREALLLLQKLYSTPHWNERDSLAAASSDLERLDARIAARRNPAQ